MHESHLFFKSFISFLFSQEFFRHEKSLSFKNTKYKILQLVRSQNNAEKSQTSSAVIFFSFVPRWRRIQNKYKRLAKYSWVCTRCTFAHSLRSMSGKEHWVVTETWSWFNSSVVSDSGMRQLCNAMASDNEISRNTLFREGFLTTRSG